MNGTIEELPDDTVLVIGGGPVGLLVATVLAHHGIRSLLLERHTTTTKWPKMDLANARSMEQLRRLGLVEGFRARGVPAKFPFTVLFSSGLGAGDEAISSWSLPSVDECREQIRNCNDGTLPLEPYQRGSQEVLEAWLKEICDQNPLIDVRFGWQVESAEELESGARAVATDTSTGQKHTFFARYAAGCDGASSRVRRDLDIPLDGGPMLVAQFTRLRWPKLTAHSPAYALLVHFKSRDLRRLHRQGQFWHIFFPHPEVGLKSAIIAQDEVDTWTTHIFLPLDFDANSIESLDAIQMALGGMGENYPIDVDEILVRSNYRPSIAVARHYHGPKGKIYLAGDAAHQNIATGGFGMNMGLEDAFELGWKLAAVMKGYGGPNLLTSYEHERRPVALMAVERSGRHLSVHMDLPKAIPIDPEMINSPSEKGQDLRRRLHDYYQLHDQENKDLGIEMGYRYTSSICMPDEAVGPPPDMDPSRYIPSTYPGCRAPHVFLKDGSAIFDHYGKDFSLIEFSDNSDRGVQYFIGAAGANSLPLTIVSLRDEDHAFRIWGARLVIVRPDGHVSWRGERVGNHADAEKILKTVSGWGPSLEKETDNLFARPFTSTKELETQTGKYEMEHAAPFQK